MSLNKEKIYHDNDFHCFANHICIDCEHENTLFDEEPCVLCIGTSKHNRLCKWK